MKGKSQRGQKEVKIHFRSDVSFRNFKLSGKCLGKCAAAATAAAAAATAALRAAAAAESVLKG